MLASSSAKEKMTLEKGDAGQKILAGLVGGFDKTELVNLALVFMERRREAKHGLDPRFAMELALAAACEGMAARTGQTAVGSVQTNKNSNQDSDRKPPSATSKPEQPKSNPPIQATKPDPSALAKDQPKNDAAPVCSLDQILIKWQPFLDSLENNKSLLFILKLCKPLEVVGNRVVLRFQYPYHKQTIIGNVKNKQLVEDALRKALGVPNLIIDGTEGKDAAETTTAAPSTMSRLMDAFGGQVAT